MNPQQALELLWSEAKPTERFFDPTNYRHLSLGAQLYLQHAMKPGAPLARAARLSMSGELKLKGWCPFTAEQVIVWDRGFVWKAVVKMKGLPVSGADSLLAGEGAMQWKMFGLIPVMSASGPNITRSAAGRVIGEATWLPGVFCDESTIWNQTVDDQTLQATLKVFDEETDLTMHIDSSGRLETIRYMRWGNPDNTAYRAVDFGGIIEEESLFEGVTVPSKLRIGWHYGTDRFEPEGEFFRGVIHAIRYK